MSRSEEIAAAGGEIEADRRLTNCQMVLARRIGPRKAQDIMIEISSAGALEGLEALLRQTRKHYINQGGDNAT